MELKYAIEAILFASDKPLTADQIKQAFPEGVSAKEITEGIEALRADYESMQRGFKLFELAGGFQLVTDPRFSEYLKRFYEDREKKRLSQASLETLSVIAYRQPVTRADIEFIRGVNVDGAIKSLMDKRLIKIVGRKDVPGRPILYGTTQEFLDHFGLGSLKDLPVLPEYSLKDIPVNMLPPELQESVENQEAGSGEQKPIGCANTPEEEATS